MITEDIGPWVYTASGSNNTFPYLNKIFEDTDLVVTVDGAVQSLSAYDVTGVGETEGGNVVFGTNPTAGARIVIDPQIPARQTSEPLDDGVFPAQTLEDGLDRAMRIAQQEQGKFLRAIRLPATSGQTFAELPGDKTSFVGKVIIGDSNGDPTFGTPTTDVVVQASESVAGIAELATQAEVNAGADASRIVTPATLATRLAAAIAAANVAAIAGLVGLKVIPNSGAPNDKVDVTIDQACLSDGAGDSIVFASQSFTIDVTQAGPVVNGRDQNSAFTAGSWVHLWAISNDTLCRGLASASASAPTLPSGYTKKAYLGAVRYDGSSHLVKTSIFGDTAYYQGAQQALSTTAPATSATAVALSTLVPPNASEVYVEVDLTGATSNGAAVAFLVQLEFISGTVFAQARTNAGPVTGTEAPFSQNDHVWMPIGASTQIFYRVTNTTNVSSQTLVLNVLGYKVANGAG